jgi:NAD(P)-dependent dehydrogenase (short-subunit alcohol dehydrogenase family)
MLHEKSGKKVVVTGASAGFGKGAALEFADDGAWLERRGELLDVPARECAVVAQLRSPCPRT